SSPGSTLRVVLGWSDPDNASTLPLDDFGPPLLVNDLDLKVIDPAGNEMLPYVLDARHPELPATSGVNHVDNNEELEISNAQTGTYRIVVAGTKVTVSSPQSFVVITNADLGS